MPAQVPMDARNSEKGAGAESSPPAARGRGVGSALFRAAAAWARGRGCWQLGVETQNVNVAACRLYARQGCMLASVDRFAYPGLPGEIRLLWRTDVLETTPIG